ncbi:MAG: RodZ domain-containing protein [Pseudomonadota bacterium]
MSVEGPGALLRAAREKLSIEVREISDALNLPISAIEAIERNDFDVFQAPVFARGHVRSYARLVELNVDEVLAAFPGAVGPTGEISQVGAAVTGSAPAVPEPPGAVPEFLRRLRRLFDELYREQPTVTLVSLGAIAALLVLLLWWLFSDDAVEPPVAATPAAAAAPPPVATPATSPFASIARESSTATAPAAELQPADETDAAAATVEPEADVPEVVIDPAAEAMPDAAVAEAEAPAAAADSAAVVRRMGDGEDRLYLTFTADCWVDVKNAAGRGLFSNLGKADTSLELIGDGPFRILLGYAPGATLAFNGDPVTLAPHTRNNVARLVVGQ